MELMIPTGNFSKDKKDGGDKEVGNLSVGNECHIGNMNSDIGLQVEDFTNRKVWFNEDYLEARCFLLVCLS